MTLKIPFSGRKHATIISACASTMTNPDEVKDKFYDDLDYVISATPQIDKLIHLWDFNASQTTRPGKEWLELKCSSNGLLLLRKCADHELPITNTVFRLLTRNKTSWMQPRTKHWHLNDHVCDGRTDSMSEWQRLCVVQTVGQMTGLLLANSTCAFSLHSDHKARKCQRDWMSPNWNKTTRVKYSEPMSSSVKMHWNTYQRIQLRTGQSSETPFPLQQLILQDQYLANMKTGLMKWQNPGTPWRETPKTQGIPQWYQPSIKQDCLFNHM